MSKKSLTIALTFAMGFQAGVLFTVNPAGALVVTGISIVVVWLAWNLL